MTYRDWLDVFIALGADRVATCPNCARGPIRWRFAANDDRIGFGVIWCEACLKGARLSRVRIPDRFDTLPISDIEEFSRGVPSIDFVED